MKNLKFLKTVQTTPRKSVPAIW